MMLKKIGFYMISIMILLFFVIFLDIKLCGYNKQINNLFDFLCCNWFTLICIILVLISIGILIYHKNQLNGVANPCCRITKIENVNYEFLTFLTTYIIPLICFDFDNVRYKIIFLVLLFIIGVIFVKMDLYIANPIFAIMGYKLYKIDVDKKDNNKDIIVITRTELVNNVFIDWIELDDNCWYVKRRNNGSKRYKVKN